MVAFKTRRVSMYLQAKSQRNFQERYEAEVEERELQIQQFQQLQAELEAKDEQIGARDDTISRQQNSIALKNSQLEDLARMMEVSGSIMKFNVEPGHGTM